MVVGLAVVLFFVLVFVLYFLLVNELVLGLVIGLVLGLVLGLGFGLTSGLGVFEQHFALRFRLWRVGAMPWRYVRFLDYAAECILLRKVGGGYIFVHRLLLDYFASLETAAVALAVPDAQSSSSAAQEHACPHCGESLPASARFCGRCGQPLTTSTRDGTKATPGK